MKILGQRLLVEQTLTRKNDLLYMGKNEEDNFETSYEIIGLGQLTEEQKSNVKIGDKPVFGKYVDFSALRLISKTPDVVVANIIVNYDDIVAIDNQGEIE
jgi:hypothetical protein